VTLALALEAERQAARRFHNSTPLRLGMKATMRGREYELTGRIVISMMEEGVRYPWDEFLLVSSDGDCLFLEYDEGQWKLTETFVPNTPVSPQEAVKLGVQGQVNLDGVSAHITQISRATINFVEGELTWAAEAGDSVDYFDAQGFGRIYSVEWSEDEIEFYKGQFLSNREVFVAFGLKNELSALDAMERARKAQNQCAVLFLGLAIIAFIGYGYALGSGTLVNGGQAQADINGIPPAGIAMGPIKLDPVGRVHRLTIHGSMNQASAWVAAVLETADGDELIGTQGDFWDETGQDSDGPWHEWDLRSQSDFVIREAGTYNIRLMTERETIGGSYQNVAYQLRSGAIYPGYFLLYGIFVLILSVLYFCIGNREKLKKMSEEADD
jgi:hypothetical protein